jgi:type II secretory pathway component PulF
MYQSFVDYLSQGIPINDIVKLLSVSIIKANAKSQMFQVKILEDIELQLRTGIEFADALARWAPVSEVMSIRAGMRSGDPVVGMKNTIDALDAAGAMMSTIFAKLSYPAVLLLALCGLIYFFSVSVIPEIEAVLPASDWPPVAKRLHAMASFMENDWYTLLIGLIFFSVVAGWTMPRVTGKLRTYLDAVPPFSFYKAFHGAGLLISLASLMRSGIAFADALEDLKRLSSPYLRSHLDTMTAHLASGKSLGESLDTGLLSSDMMVSVYMMSHNSDFQSAISEIGKHAIARSVEKISVISAMLNGLALLGVAGYVGWVYYALYTVTNQMAGSVG